MCEDAQRGKGNLSMAWIDVAKAYDSVDHMVGYLKCSPYTDSPYCLLR